MKPRHPPGEINERVLHDILRGGVIEAGMARDVVNEPPVAIEELAPSVLVLAIAQARQKAPARRQQRIGGRLSSHLPLLSPSRRHPFKHLELVALEFFWTRA